MSQNLNLSKFKMSIFLTLFLLMHFVATQGNQTFSITTNIIANSLKHFLLPINNNFAIGNHIIWPSSAELVPINRFCIIINWFSPQNLKITFKPKRQLKIILCLFLSTFLYGSYFDCVKTNE